MANILIADDVKDMRNLLQGALEAEGHRCIEAESGQKVLEELEFHQDIHIALLDLAMPDGDGFSCGQWILQNRPQVKMCFLSGSKDRDTLSKIVSLGVKHFLVKPVNINVLTAKIKELLDETAEEQRVYRVDWLASLLGAPLELDVRISGVSSAGFEFISPLAFRANAVTSFKVPFLTEIGGDYSVLKAQIKSSVKTGNSTYTVKCAYRDLDAAFFERVKTLLNVIR